MGVPDTGILAYKRQPSVGTQLELVTAPGTLLTPSPYFSLPSVPTSVRLRVGPGGWTSNQEHEIQVACSDQSKGTRTSYVKSVRPDGLLAAFTITTDLKFRGC